MSPLDVVFGALVLGSAFAQIRDYSPPPQDAAPFNVDLAFPIHVHLKAAAASLPFTKSTRPALFGSSVLVTTPSESSDSDSPATTNLFVGSPAHTSNLNVSVAPGGIFKCPFDVQQPGREIECEQLAFPEGIRVDTDDRESLRYAPTDGSLLGFNLFAVEEKVISCAPNWVANDSPEGVCFVFDNLGNVNKAFKLEKKRALSSTNRPFESHALFGFSLVYSQNPKEVLVGIPGFNDFSGSVSYLNDDFRVTRREIAFNLPKKNSYTGYAVALAMLDRTQYILLGSPRYDKFNGRVELIRNTHRRLQTHFVLEGSSDVKGEFYGASLLVVSTSLPQATSHLLVGAPFFSLRNRREMGRVYLYRNLRADRENRQQTVLIMPKSPRTGAHFGATLASIDINMDGIPDVIISAPFEGSNPQESSGAIYIYYGTPSGIDLFSEHRIGAERFSSTPPLRGFGYSIWTQSDVDDNGYSDLVIGSVLSENVTILRSIPILKFSVGMHFDRKGVNLTDTRSCVNENACFRVNYCIVTDQSRPLPGQLSYSVQFVVTDSKLRSRENRVVKDKISSIVTTNQNSICREREQAFHVQIKKKEELFDISTPIQVQITVSLIRSSVEQFCSWCPVAKPVTVTKEIGWEHGCAKERCVAQLELRARFKYGPDLIDGAIVQGRFDNFEIEVDVSNLGESSIDTVLLISITPVIPSMDITSQCQLKDQLPGYLCDVNKLLEKDKSERFRLRFNLDAVALPSLSFEMRLNSSSEISPQSRLMASKRISIEKEAQFRLTSNQNGPLNYSFSEQTAHVPFTISLSIEKQGPSLVNATYVQFFLPADIIEIEEASRYNCHPVTSVSASLSNWILGNGTLRMPCIEQPEKCIKYHCNLGAFESGTSSASFGPTLRFTPSRISSRLAYEKMHFRMKMSLLTEDTFFEQSHPFDTIETDILFERQVTRLPKSSPLIMMGGGAIGLFILLVTVIVLIKNGFFKRKKREQLLRAKQRMSMAPNAFPNALPGLDQADDDNETDR